MFLKLFFSGLSLVVICLFIKYHVLKSEEEIASPLVNLVESTQIIRQLISQNSLSRVLEEHDPEQLSLLLDNVSPATMAFESEVLSTTIPLVVVYYCCSDDLKNEILMLQLEDLAFKYDDRIKFVVVDVERLYSLAQDADIKTTPTILIFKGREIIECLEEIDAIEDALGVCIEF